MDKRKKGNRVISVYQREDRWCIEMMLDGKRKYEYRASEKSARQRANHWREKFGQPLQPVPGGPVKTSASVAKYWESQLRKMAELLLLNPDDDGVRQSAKMMAGLAAAAIKTVGHIEGPDEETGQVSTLDVTKMTDEELMELAGGSDE